ncbi:ECF transporter S component [Sporosalibacterium faouarense]|uniref:ECF transporter S component n=1 Tax=Sporosalibacterium faouarense TaxID=516123 RepID=UPI00141C8BD7|nr:ECF transporter S component [Sporosalibacterium faouarense]MTI46223.1 ECF transporter S component [Bacillota bacterium]
MNENFTVQYITRTAVLLAISLVFQIGLNGLGQGVVGPLVNFTLLVSVGLVGILSGIIIGCFTPLIAFFVGLMPLAPVVPFVIIGNSILVILFGFIRKRIAKNGDYIGIIVAAIGKFAFLAISARYLIGLFTKVPGPLVTALSLPQLYTALVGGVLAIIVMRLLPKSTFIKS